MAITQLRFTLHGKKYAEPVKNRSVGLKHLTRLVVARHLSKLCKLERDDAFSLLDSNVIEIEEITDKEGCDVNLDISAKDLDEYQYESLTLSLTSKSLKYISSHQPKRNMPEEEGNGTAVPNSIFVQSDHLSSLNPSPPEGQSDGSSPSFQAPTFTTEELASETATKVRDSIKALLQRFVKTENAEEAESFLDYLSMVRNPWTELGKAYLHGIFPCPVDYAQCFRVLKIATEINEPKSLKYTRTLIGKACDMAKRESLTNEIVSFLLDNADNGIAVAALALGRHYKKKNLHEESLQWYIQAKNGGELRTANEEIESVIDKVCSVRIGKEMSDTMTSFVLEAANKGSAVAALTLGFHYKLRKLFRESLEWFTLAPQKDSGLSKLANNEMKEIFVLLSGSLESSPNESFVDILETYSERHPFVAARLGYLYDIGAVGVGKVDETKAFQLFSMAATEGKRETQWNLGLHYLHGMGVQKNKQLGMEWLEKAAENGFEEASSYLKLIKAKYSASSQPFKWKIRNIPF